MLVRFAFENFRSFLEPQELLFTAANVDKNKTFTKLIDGPSGIGEKILPVSALFGPNNTGKTNALRALRFMQRAVKYASGIDKKPRINHFRLSDRGINSPSTFDLEFICNGKHFNYGFTYLGEECTQEWLYEYSYVKRRSRRTLFERVKGEDIFFGPHFKGNNKVIENSLEKHDLFLSYAGRKFKNEVCLEIYNYFNANLKFRFEGDLRESSIAEALFENDNTKKLLEFLNDTDIDIQNIRVEEVEMDAKSIERNRKLFQAISQALDTDFEYDSNDSRKEVFIEKLDEYGKLVSFSLEEESLGTRALISLMTEIFNILNTGGVFIVDELESSLHPHVTQRILELFLDKSININGAQLFFTTHESSILNFDLMRKDEVWITERDSKGVSTIFPLIKYKINSKVNLNKGYLEGRFGGVPTIYKTSK
ncbi:AAA family ATPase [Alteromonas macleodii]|uniref:AAA family ATPase n=1 Tax=Alteromonas macleodii TaxID=28108 RepID=UPI0022AFB5F7|nr:ATP-binding protein [Alteromonas macleodii]MCZ4238557.1 ATP-binding protein [Alteromonas macleodii]